MKLLLPYLGLAVTTMGFNEPHRRTDVHVFALDKQTPFARDPGGAGAPDTVPMHRGNREPSSSSPTSTRAKRTKESTQRRREQWCQRYKPLVDGSITYMELPFVGLFWGQGLDLGQVDQTFMAMKKTEKDYLYRAWVRHRYRIRATEFNRRGNRGRYRRYIGQIMDAPEILALGRQLHTIQKKMRANKRESVFNEMLGVILSFRRGVHVRYDARQNRTYKTVVSRYHPKATVIEGGCTDSRTMPLFTLDQFLAGKAPYVSIALDRKLYGRNRIRYGDEFWILELDDKYRSELNRLNREHIVFRAVDTGDGFTDKGFSRLDLCVSTRSYETRYHNGGKTIGRVTLVKVHREVTLLPGTR